MNWEDLDRIPMMQDSAYHIALTVPEINLSILKAYRVKIILLSQMF